MNVIWFIIGAVVGVITVVAVACYVEAKEEKNDK